MIQTPFAMLSAAGSRALADASHLRYLDQGDLLFEDGDHGSSLFLISSGLVAVQVRSGGGAMVTVAVRGPGDLLGEMALFAKDERRSATATARTRSRLLELDSEACVLVRRDHPDVNDLLLQILAERSAALSRQLADRGRDSSQAAVVKSLLGLPVPADPDEPIPVTSWDLSGMSGLSEPEVEELIAVLQNESLIVWSRGVTIVDRPALEVIASLP